MADVYPINVDGSNYTVTVESGIANYPTDDLSITSDFVAGGSITSSGDAVIGGNAVIGGDTDISGSLSIGGESVTMTASSEPSSPVNGMLYYDSSSNELRLYDGSSWRYINMDLTAGQQRTIGWSMPSSGVTAAGSPYYVGGYYIHSGSSNDFNPAVNFGTANLSYAAHFFVVATSGATDTEITVTGTSITDAGVRTTSDTEVLQLTDGTAGVYYETSKKWLGQVSVEKTAGTDRLCDYGFSKYWDNGNRDFAINGVEALWLGGASGDLEVELIHHKATGWTYTGSGATPPTPILDMGGIHSTDIAVASGVEGAFKRVGLSTDVEGSGSEGVIFAIKVSANNLIDSGTINMGITY